MNISSTREDPPQAPVISKTSNTNSGIDCDDSSSCDSSGGGFIRGSCWIGLSSSSICSTSSIGSDSVLIFIQFFHIYVRWLE